MAMRTTWLLVGVFGVACAPARAGSPDKQPLAIATAEPVVTATPSLGAVAKAPIQLKKDRLRWIEGPPVIPRSRMAILEGNPKEASLYTLRLSIPAGSKIAPHSHPQDERVTVLEGSVLIGLGDVADDAKATRMKAGDYYVTPAGTHHWVSFDEATVIQMTSVGPWEVIPLQP